MKACVLIPSYNEGKTIGNIVKEIRKMGIAVIVVDDGSQDDTEKHASENGAIVIRHIRNVGKGASLREGFEFILKSTNFDAIIIMDGDGQHNPNDIQKFLSCACRDGVDIIVGNRMHQAKGMPFVRLVTNKVMSALLSSICKQDIPDTQCGFKLIRRKVLEKITLNSASYDFDSELLIQASRKHFKITSVPIRTIYRGEKSYIKPLRDTLRFIRLLLKSRKK